VGSATGEETRGFHWAKWTRPLSGSLMVSAAAWPMLRMRSARTP
jgi:hypothetical protein